MKPPLHAVWLAPLHGRLRKPPALFLDFDGTLAPIAPRPDTVRLDAEGRRLIRTLSRLAPVAIISGRAVKDLRARVGLTRLTYVGNHGLEIDGIGFRYRMKGARRWRRRLREILHRIRSRLDVIPGVLIEDKQVTASVHFRLVKGRARRTVARRFVACVKPYVERGRMRLRRGKAVWEIRPPVAWDKGRAVLWILNRPAFRGRWPMYIGDDDTDQDAFRRIRGRGVGISVGPGRARGAARYAIAGPAQVRRLLTWVAAQLSGSRAADEDAASSAVRTIMVAMNSRRFYTNFTHLP